MRTTLLLLAIACITMCRGTSIVQRGSFMDMGSSSLVAPARMLAASSQACSCVYNKIYGTMRQRILLVGAQPQDGQTVFGFRLVSLDSSRAACNMQMSPAGGLDCCNAVATSFNISLATGSNLQVVDTSYQGAPWMGNTIVSDSSVAFFNIPSTMATDALFTITTLGEFTQLPCGSAGGNDGLCDYLVVAQGSAGGMCCGMGALSAVIPTASPPDVAPPPPSPGSQGPSPFAGDCVSSLVYGQSRYRIAYTSSAPSGSHTKYFFKLSAVSADYCSAACYRSDGACCDAPLSSFSLSFTGDAQDVVAASVNGSDWLSALTFTDFGVVFGDVGLTADAIPAGGLVFSLTLANSGGLPCGPSKLDPTSSDMCDYVVSGANCCNQGLTKAAVAAAPAPAAACEASLDASPYRLAYVSKTAGSGSTTFAFKITVVAGKPTACGVMGLDSLTIGMGEAAMGRFKSASIGGMDVTSKALVRPGDSLGATTLTIKEVGMSQAQVKAAAPLSVEVVLDGDVEVLCGGEPEELLALGAEACDYSFTGSAGSCCPVGVTLVPGADAMLACPPPPPRKPGKQ